MQRYQRYGNFAAYRSCRFLVDTERRFQLKVNGNFQDVEKYFAKFCEATKIGQLYQGRKQIQFMRIINYSL